MTQKVSTGDYHPTDADAAYERYEELQGMLKEQKGRLQQILDTDVVRFNQILSGLGLKTLEPMS